MKFTPGQIKYIKSWIKNIDMILVHEPKVGDIGLKLQKRELETLLKINEVE